MDIKQNKKGLLEFVENAAVRPRLVCFYNESDWKKIMEDEFSHPIEDMDAPQFRSALIEGVLYLFRRP